MTDDGSPPLLSRLTLWFDRHLGRRFYPWHRRLYRATGGMIGRHSGVGQILLLTTTGRRSGEARTTPLLFVPSEGGYYVVGSNGARAAAPAWVGNLRATPQATVQVGRRTVAVLSEILGEEERSAVWPGLVARFPGWGHYQSRTERVLPVVRLRPLPSLPGARDGPGVQTGQRARRGIRPDRATGPTGQPADEGSGCV